MTTPTNRPTNRPGDDDSQLEARLRATFERAIEQAEKDLPAERLVSHALNRGRRGRGAGLFRAGLAVAALAVLGGGAVVLVGGSIGRTPPTAPPAPSAIGQLQPPTPQGSPVPAPGSPMPIASPPGDVSPSPTGWAMPSGTIVPEVSPGWPFPSSVDGEPVYAVGGPAEQHIAAATDDTPFLMSGWEIPEIPPGYAGPAGCGDFSLGTPAPNGVFFRDCAGTPLFANAGGGAALVYYFGVRDGVAVGLAETAPMESTQVRRIIVRVHVRDRGCLAADCMRKPVLDEILLTGDVRLDPAIVAASLPPKGVSMQDAIATALAAVRGGYGTGYPHVLSVSLGTAAVLGDDNAGPGPAGGWEWKIVASTDDGQSVATAYVDYVTGVCDQWGAAGSGSLGR